MPEGKVTVVYERIDGQGPPIEKEIVDSPQAKELMTRALGACTDEGYEYAYMKRGNNVFHTSNKYKHRRS